MKITVSEEINAPREHIWKLITDADSWADTITGIASVEVIDKPEIGVMRGGMFSPHEGPLRVTFSDPLAREDHEASIAKDPGAPDP